MIKNLFSQLPGLKHLSSDATEAREADELQAKKERIEFHQKHVRNGPVKGRPATNGQIRRQRIRDARRMSRKGYEKQVQAFFASQHEIALLRVHLQRVGVLPWGSETTVSTPEQIERSIVWLLKNFHEGDIVIEGDVTVAVESAIQQAYDRYAALTGLPAKKVEINSEVFAA